EARVRGFQGKGVGATDAVLACVKHFAGYGASLAGRDYNTVDMSERFFREYYLPPYEAAVKAGAATVMTSFNDYDGVPATGNKYLLTDILREEWGFKGFIVTDYTSINEMVNHGVVANDKEAGELALNAGVDMDMQGGIYQRYLAQSVKEGKVKMTDIEEGVRRILRLKYALGLFDNPYKFCDAQRERDALLAPEHRRAAREVARKSIVLLKNANQALPLNPAAGRLAVIGPLADNQSDLIGAWSGAGDGKDCVSLLAGIKSAYKGEVLHVKGCDVEGADRSGFEAALAAAAAADAVVVAVGERFWMSGEASSRADISLPGVQEDLVAALAATGKPVIVVLMNGRPLAIPRLVESASALLETWWLGAEAGNAIADVLFGAYNPSGKLPMSFPRHVGQVPVFYNEKSTGRPFDPNSKWTSKYVDMPNAPLFAFGYGLSYTSFQYDTLQLSKSSFKKGETITVRVRVHNTGQYDGEEVVQLYVRDLVGSVTRPVKELKGFRKILIPKGTTQTVEFSLSEADLRFYGRNLRFDSEPGEF
ncbi:MAG: glycoside hydrolase family 3 C-terminal domain-containing protein, partial [Saprospiraceae bacterium]